MTQVASLPGLDGSNPLAFMTALGTLRVLSLRLPNEAIRMHWTIETGTWCPVLSSLSSDFEGDVIVANLAEYLAEPDELELLGETRTA